MKLAIRFFVASIVVVMGVSTLRAEETKGTIKSVDTTKNEVVLKGAIRNTIYELKKDAAVCIDGKKSNLSDLREGDTVMVNYEKSGEHYMASEVRGLRNAQETTGTVRSTSPDRNEIVIKGIVKDTTYELNKDGTIWLNTGKSSLKDIREGDQVTITYMTRGDQYFANRVRVTRR